MGGRGGGSGWVGGGNGEGGDETRRPQMAVTHCSHHFNILFWRTRKRPRLLFSSLLSLYGNNAKRIALRLSFPTFSFQHSLIFATFLPHNSDSREVVLQSPKNFLRKSTVSENDSCSDLLLQPTYNCQFLHLCRLENPVVTLAERLYTDS